MAAIEIVSDLVLEPASPALDAAFKISGRVKRSADAGPVHAWFEKDGTPIETSREDVDSRAKDEPIDVKVQIDTLKSSDAGTYVLCASETRDGMKIDLGSSATRKVSLDAPESPAAAGPVELRDLVWDKHFAQNTGMFAGIVFFAVATLSVIGFVAALRHGLAGNDITTALAFLMALVGGVAVIAGTWLVALEMRGRAPVEAGADEAPVAKGFGAEEIKATSELVKSIGSLRGPIALLVVGGLLLGGAATLAAFTIDDAPSSPTESA
jgi:hypothetical protein